MRMKFEYVSVKNSKFEYAIPYHETSEYKASNVRRSLDIC